MKQRPIDANDLRTLIVQDMDLYGVYGDSGKQFIPLYRVLLDIDTRKTINPAKHAHWIKELDFWRKCSACGEVWHETWVGSRQLKYCSNCGAKMKYERI